MAKSVGLAQKFFLHGYDVSGDVGSVDGCAIPTDMIDVTAIDKSARENIAGKSSSELAWTAYFNDATVAHHEAHKSLVRTDLIASWFNGQAIGDAVFVITGKNDNQPGTRGQDGSFTFAPHLAGSGQDSGAWMLAGSAGVDVSASAGSESSIDSGAGTSNGLESVLHTIDIDSGTPTMTIEDSANDSTWATLKAFSAVADGSEPTAERVEIAGTVDRYLRITGSGTYSNLDFAWAYRRGSANDRVALG
jgi:hypothetical protein